ncbi:hypothetical protein, partial [Blautia obeum]|uniref:hypothetical protein n=1 Tax=Blautia obeum TaxID=40520 RepID=UPI0022E924B5
LPADLEVLFLWVELNVHQYVEVMHFIWEITQLFCVVFILTKWRGKQASWGDNPACKHPQTQS